MINIITTLPVFTLFSVPPFKVSEIVLASSTVDAFVLLILYIDDEARYESGLHPFDSGWLRMLLANWLVQFSDSKLINRER